MMIAEKKLILYFVLIGVVAVLLLLSMTAPFVASDADFSIYNTEWNGCSELAARTQRLGKFSPELQLAEGKEAEVNQRELAEYDIEGRQTSIFIIGPEQEFTSEEIEFIDRFLSEGGRLLLADDFGSGNSLLDGLDTDSSFDHRVLKDLAFSKDPNFGIAYETREHEITDNVSQVMLNKPTAIRKDESSISLLNSSTHSWLGEEIEEFNQFPLATIESYGEGELILLSDPSIFINSMNEEMDNDILIQNLLVYLSEGRENIIFEESKRDLGLTFEIIYRGNYPSRGLTALILLAGLGISIVKLSLDDILDLLKHNLMRLLAIFREEEQSEKDEDPITKVLNKHPDWDKNKLKLINQRFIREGR